MSAPRQFRGVAPGTSMDMRRETFATMRARQQRGSLADMRARQQRGCAAPTPTPTAGVQRSPSPQHGRRPRPQQDRIRRRKLVSAAKRVNDPADQAKASEAAWAKFWDSPTKDEGSETKTELPDEAVARETTPIPNSDLPASPMAKGRGKQGTKGTAEKKTGPRRKAAVTDKEEVDEKKTSRAAYADSVLSKLPGLRAALDAGFDTVATSSDGNCLFNALSAQLYGHEDRSTDLRKTAVCFMRNNADEFKLWMTSDDVQETKRHSTRSTRRYLGDDQTALLERYLRDMAKDGVWASEHELSALSRALDVHITVYASLIATPNEYNAGGRGRAFVYYDENGRHYSGLCRPGDGHASKDRELQAGFDAKLLSDSESSTSSKRSFSARGGDDSDEDVPRKKANTKVAARRRLETPAMRAARDVATAARPSSSSSSMAAASFSTSGTISCTSATPPSSNDGALLSQTLGSKFRPSKLGKNAKLIDHELVGMELNKMDRVQEWTAQKEKSVRSPNSAKKAQPQHDDAMDVDRRTGSASSAESLGLLDNLEL